MIISISLLSGCSLIPPEEEAIKPPLVKPAEQNYSTELVKKDVIRREIKGSGVFESTETELAQFTAKGGRLKKLHVQSGDAVKKGDLLAELTVDGLDVQLLEQQLVLEQSRYALKELERSSSDEELIRMAELKLAIEQLKSDKLAETLETSQLRATMNGLVVFVEDLKTGDYVEPYQTLVGVANPDKLRFAYQSSDAGLITEAEVGMKAEITTRDGFSGIGQVVQTPSSAPSTTNEQLANKYKNTLYITLDKLPADLKIGASGDLAIILAEHKDALIIPRSGLRSYLGRTFVRVLEEGKALREIDVEVGIQSSTKVEITAGLEEGQTIVLN